MLSLELAKILLKVLHALLRYFGKTIGGQNDTPLGKGLRPHSHEGDFPGKLCKRKRIYLYSSVAFRSNPEK